MIIPEIQRIATHALRTGWLDFGLPADKKSPPPTGWIGYRQPKNLAEVRAHHASLVDGQNLGTRVSYGVVGIDIDSYEKNGVTKVGGQFITHREQSTGIALPPTWYSTRRGPQALTGPTRTAIYFYRLPQWLLTKCERRGQIPRLKDTPLPGVEIVQWHTRYAVVHPSVVDGMAYAWYRPDGTTEPGLLPPRTADLPTLPDRWVQMLSDNAVPISRVRAARQSDSGIGHADPSEALAWCAANITGWDDEPGTFLQAQVEKHIATLHSGAGRYPTTRDAVWHLLNLAVGDHEHPGNAGGGHAIHMVLQEFIALRRNDNDERKGINESARILTGAIEKVRTEIDTGQRRMITSLWL
ncbi:hypothetical protein ACFVKB_01915 [Rhodococcus sp. NPDC127530]|uniref:hypothetical protein n=1 Tax=unclassified Rhodococcus (in: high G+C Gram-positive bacteria) TaxID=192944 RepID=UPI00363DEA0F